MRRLTEVLRDYVPAVDTHYRIGMRVVKTAASVGICLILALFTGGMGSAPISAVSAIVTVRPTQGETLSTGVFRLLGTIIGGVLGIATVIIGLFLPYYNEGLFVVVIPVMLLLNLYFCNVLNMQDSCVIACVVTIIVAAHVTPEDASVGEALVFTLMRVRDTFIGVIVATVMNIVPYKISGLRKKRQADGAPEVPEVSDDK